MTITVRIDPQALAVLEWDARLSGVKLRARLRDMLEAEAEAISVERNLPDVEPPTAPAIGLFVPRIPSPR